MKRILDVLSSEVEGLADHWVGWDLPYPGGMLTLRLSLLPTTAIFSLWRGHQLLTSYRTDDGPEPAWVLSGLKMIGGKEGYA